jgi:hypothetical protein
MRSRRSVKYLLAVMAAVFALLVASASVFG